MNKHYVYVYFRLDGSPCYVGRGTGFRWKRHERGETNTHLFNIIQQAGGTVPKIKVRENLTLRESVEIEIALIKAIGREVDGGPLVNLAVGGEAGSAGTKMSKEWREHRSKKAKEVWQNPQFREKRREAMLGNKNRQGPLTAEWKKRISESLLGNTRTKGHKHSEEARQKMRLAGRGRKQSAEHIAARASSHIGKKRSPQACENIRLGHLRAKEHRASL